MNEENVTFAKKYMDSHNGKMDSNFINKYLGNVALYQYLFGNRHHGKTNKKIENIQNVYMQGIIGQDVTNCDFSALSKEEFEQLKFDENTKFNQETIDKFHPDMILKRQNTKINHQNNNFNQLNIAIIDGTLINFDNNKKLQIKNYNDGEIPVEEQDSYHGRSVYSVFSSINPNCNVHFYGTDCENQSLDKIQENRINAVQDIIKYNQNCEKDEDKIKLVSCSHNLSDEENSLLSKANINVISPQKAHGDFFDCFKFENSYKIPFDFTKDEKTEIVNIYSKSPELINELSSLFELSKKIKNNSILINKNLTIDNNINSYNGKTKRHDCSFSTSFTVPVIAAYFSMALEKNPNMKYNEFYNICKKSIEKDTHIFDEKSFEKNLNEIYKDNDKQKVDMKKEINGEDLSL